MDLEKLREQLIIDEGVKYETLPRSPFPKDSRHRTFVP